LKKTEYGLLKLTHRGWKFIRRGNEGRITYDLFTVPDNWEDGGLVEVLNRLAEMRWEVVTVFCGGVEQKYVVLLKRWFYEDEGGSL